MIGDIYVAVSAVSFVAWLVTHVTWMRWLGSANGTRPFIRSTVTISWTMVIFSAVVLGIALIDKPYSFYQYVAGFSTHATVIVVCGVMWLLHDSLHKIGPNHGHPGESE